MALRRSGSAHHDGRECVPHRRRRLPPVLGRLGQRAPDPRRQLGRDAGLNGPEVGRHLIEMHLQHDGLVPVHERRLTGQALDPSVRVLPPFHTDGGRRLRFGRNVFVNHGCTAMDFGGIDIGDDVMIGPNVQLISSSLSKVGGQDVVEFSIAADIKVAP